MESMIFIILGVMLVNEYDFWKHWNTPFSIIALVLVFFVRFIGKQVKRDTLLSLFYFEFTTIIFFAVTFALTAIVNWRTEGVRKISFNEQVIMVSEHR